MSDAVSSVSLSSEAPLFSKRQLVAKRVLDITLSMLGLVILSPLMLLIAAAIKLTSRGPVLFRWHVVGRYGTPFVGYKFRTMVVGADAMREKLSGQNEMTGPFFKMKSDPRVIPVGRFLRRFSLDELPQLWSVLTGDMSLVGPRPTQLFEYVQMAEWQRTRVYVKPGAVSLWIVSGKVPNFDSMVHLDLDYIREWSVWLDLKVLVRMIPYVVFGKNT